MRARVVLILTVLGLILASCSIGDGDATPTATVSTCTSPGTGEEQICALDVGTYRTAYSLPGMTYTMSDPGWGSLDRPGAAGIFVLVPAGATLEEVNEGLADDILIVAAVVPPGYCTGEPSTELPHTYDGLVTFLTSNPAIVVTNVHDASVGGLDGTVMDVAVVEGGDGCPGGSWVDLYAGVDPAHGIFGPAPEPGRVTARLYLLRDGSATLAVQIDDPTGGSDYGDGEDWLAVAEDVIDTIVFP